MAHFQGHMTVYKVITEISWLHSPSGYKASQTQHQNKQTHKWDTSKYKAQGWRVILLADDQNEAKPNGRV